MHGMLKGCTVKRAECCTLWYDCLHHHIFVVYVCRDMLKAQEAIAVWPGLGVMACGTLQASSPHILWYIVWGVKDSVHGVNFGKFQHAAIAQLTVGIKLPSPEAGFKDAEGRDLH